MSYLRHSDAKTSANPVNIVRFSTKNLVAYTSGNNSLNIGEGYDGARLNSKKAAHDSIHRIDKAITKVNEHRAFLGSTQNRLKHVLNVLDIKIENNMQSKSRISDTDFAAESSHYMRFQIQQNAATSVLSSANVAPKQALSLLDRSEFAPDIIRKTIILDHL